MTQSTKSLDDRFDDAIYRAFERIGNRMVNKLIDNEADSDTTGRLRDSFTFSDKRHPPDPRGSAEPTDAVPMVDEERILLIGTRTPYAKAVNYGYGSMEAGPYVYGQNGNAANYDEFVSRILEWMRDKGINADDGNNLRFAYNIANQIEKMGTYDHPFWEDAERDAKENAMKILKEEINEELKRFKNKPKRVLSIQFMK